MKASIRIFLPCPSPPYLLVEVLCPPTPPLVRAYSRASTLEQGVEQNRQLLGAFGEQYGQFIAGFYPENESGTKLHRSELFRLLDDSRPGGILLCEQVDRLSW